MKCLSQTSVNILITYGFQAQTTLICSMILMIGFFQLVMKDMLATENFNMLVLR